MCCGNCHLLQVSLVVGFTSLGAAWCGFVFPSCRRVGDSLKSVSLKSVFVIENERGKTGLSIVDFNSPIKWLNWMGWDDWNTVCGGKEMMILD